MLKYCFLFFISILFTKTAVGQKDTAVYYLNKSGGIVGTKDSADYYMLAYPSRAVTDDGLFAVKEFYMNGKIKSAGLSHTNSTQVRMEGLYTAWFANGNKMLVKHYTDGKQDGDETGYYPNGNFYYSKTTSGDKTLFNECRDSTGNVLAKNGNGKWVTFTGEDFGSSKTDGQIVNGRPEGEWNGKANDSVKFIQTYKGGILTAQCQVGADGKKTYTLGDVDPTFPGGVRGFGQFLVQNIVYPAEAKRNKTHGLVLISFVSDTDGTLTDFKVLRGIGDGCDEEAVRVLKLSPLWTPGLVDNKPVRVQYSVPITFSLGK